MKFDSTMEKRFHNDIVTTLKTAFHADTEIPTHKDEGDPTALREYLKKNYGKTMKGGTINGSANVVHYRFAASSGLTIGFSDFLERKDNNLILSWSQLTTFLRKTIDELYAVNEDEDTTAERRTYIDIILSQDMYKGLTAEDFLRQNEYCPYDFFDDDTTPSMSDSECTAEFYETDKYDLVRKCESCRNCWNTVCPEDVGFYYDCITTEKIRKSGEKYKAIIEELERENTDSENDTPFDKEALENLMSNFDENTVKCPFWKHRETLNYHEFGCVNFECSHKKQVYDCNDVDKLSAQLDMCCGGYEDCEKYRENAPQLPMRAVVNALPSSAPKSPAPAPAEIAVQLPDVPAETKPAVFDYSELDTETAAKLIQISVEMKNLKRKFYIEYAFKVAQAHELLANPGSKYNGVFGKWCESEGISRQTAANLLNLIKLFDEVSEEERANLENYGPTFLYEIAHDKKKGNYPELVDGALNGDIRNHKEYIELKNKLEASKREREVLDREVQKISAESAAKDKEIFSLKQESTGFKLRCEQAEKSNDSLQKSNAALHQENDRLEHSKDAIMIPEEKIEHMAAEMADGIIRSKEKDYDTRLREEQAENRRLKKELAEAQNSGSEEQLMNMFTILHDKAKYALKDCVSFINDGSFSEGFRTELTNKFRSFVNLLDLYFGDLKIGLNVVEEISNDFTLED